jgi:hypothetical protein
MKRTFIWLMLSSLGLVSAISPVLAKEKTRIRDLTVVVDEGSIEVSFSVENCFSPKIERTIQNGVPATFTGFVRLRQSRKLWKDKELASLMFTRRIHYDNIKKVYEVFLQETGPPIVFETLWEAKESLARVENVRVIPWMRLKGRTSYYVSVRAELEPARLPFRLENLLFFVSSGKTKTDWFVQKFKIGSFVLPGGGSGPDE